MVELGQKSRLQEAKVRALVEASLFTSLGRVGLLVLLLKIINFFI